MESPSEAERRKIQRFNLRLPAWLMPIGPETGRKVPTTTRDISADGAFFFTNEPLKVGSLIAACVILPAKDARLKMPNKIGVNFKKCRVVRVEKSGVAVRFSRKGEVGCAKGKMPLDSDMTKSNV